MSASREDGLDGDLPSVLLDTGRKDGQVVDVRTGKAFEQPRCRQRAPRDSFDNRWCPKCQTLGVACSLDCSSMMFELQGPAGRCRHVQIARGPGGSIRVRLFFVSYVPLWAMVAARAAPSGRWQWDGRTAAVIIFGLLAVYGFIDAVRLIRGSRRTSPQSFVFGEISDQGGNAAGYLATYSCPSSASSLKIGVIGPHMSCISLLRWSCLSGRI